VGSGPQFDTRMGRSQPNNFSRLLVSIIELLERFLV
jgi:hypothetical protein